MLGGRSTNSFGISTLLDQGWCTAIVQTKIVCTSLHHASMECAVRRSSVYCLTAPY